MNEPKIISAPTELEGKTEAGLAVEVSDFHGVAISNYWDDATSETVYVDPQNIPELQKALSEVLNER